MANEPFIDPQSRPDLTVDLNSKVGDLSVRQLSDILGSSAKTPIKTPEKMVVEKLLKEHPDKPIVKDHKDGKDSKDHKEPKDHKDQKDQKDHKEPKDTKDQKDQKEHKEHKDSADQKLTKDHKDGKDHKETTKEHKDLIKDNIKEQIKEQIKEEFKEGIKEEVDKIDEGPLDPGGPVEQQGIDSLIQRVSGLEQQVATLQQAGGTQAGGQG